MQTPRCFAIGDIHGHLDALDALLELLRREAGFNDSDTLIFLGDYVDRGPDSSGVLNRVRTLTTTRLRTIALLGNHDSWIKRRSVDAETFRWIQSLPHHHRWGKFFFSHAPVYQVAAEYASFEEAVRAGYDFLESYQGFLPEDLVRDPEFIGVCGHVHHSEVVIHSDHYIALDTGSGFGGRLSAMEFPSLKIYSVPTMGP